MPAPKNLFRAKTSLQWGRDQLIAEIHYDAPTQQYVGTLQWGRDQLIAEITNMYNDVPNGITSFNGAAIN